MDNNPSPSPQESPAKRKCSTTLFQSNCSVSNNDDNSVDPTHTSQSNSSHCENIPSYPELPACLKYANGLCIAHLNIWGLGSKIDQIRILLQERHFDVLGLSETFLTVNVPSSFIHIDGYTLYRKDRESHGGGIAVYVKSDLAHEFCSSINDILDIEALWLKIIRPHAKPVFLCTMYRPPSAKTDYFEKMLNTFESVMDVNHELLIIGDLNFNYVLDETLSSNPAHYIETLLNCKQLITEPTRVTKNTSTLIDHIYSTMPEYHSYSGVIRCAISDHYMVYTILKSHIKREKKTIKMVKVRDFKNFNPVTYNNDLMDCNLLHSVDSSKNIDEAWTKWSTQVTYVMNKHAPLRHHRVKHRQNPWMTREILTLMYQRDHLHQQMLKFPDNTSLRTDYRKVRNKVVKLIQQTKRDYYTTQVQGNKGAKEMWKTLKPLIKTNSRDSYPPISPDQFNEFFTQIGPDLHAKFTTPDVLHWTQPEAVHSFNFSEIDEEYLLDLLTALPLHSNLDILCFDSRLLREGAEVLVSSMTAIFNLSITQSSLPNDFKTARVTPVYKGKGSTNEPGNYRPISVIPHVAKLLEKCIQFQLVSYLDHYKFISCHQSAFIKGHSTQTSLHKLFDDMLDNINDGFSNGVCFFDLAKCFDTIDHKLLVMKLEKYGIRGKSLLWFENYLSNRTQVVNLYGCSSATGSIRTGVPQGSVLGPILFLLFINDFPSCLTTTSCNLFADDAEIHVPGSSLPEIETLLQCDVNNAIAWFTRNKLTVNTNKCFSMLFSSRPDPNQKLKLHAGNVDIACEHSSRYLGVYPDSNLKWDVHVTNLCKKVSPKLALMAKLKNILPPKCIERIYHCIIQPHIDYCLTVWGFTDNKYIDLVQRLQNRAARIVTGMYDRIQTRGIDLVKRLGWQTVRERRDYFTVLLVHRAIHETAPVNITDLFTLTSTLNPRLTRSSSRNNLYVPKVTRHAYNQSLQLNGSKIWNELPLSIKEINDFKDFKTSVKKHFSRR